MMVKVIAGVVALCLAALVLVLVVPWTPDHARRPSPSPGEADSSEGDLPRVVPPLDCVPSPVDGQGTAELSPPDPVPVNGVATFHVTFTVGGAGIVPRGFVIFQVSPWWGWSPPQTLDPRAPGYVRVETSFEDPSLQVVTLRLDRILVYSDRRGFEPGDRVTFHYGPARVDRFAEREELFQIFVDADGDGHYAAIARPPRIRILPGRPAALAVNVPSRARPGDEITLSAAALDGAGNWTELSPGVYRCRLVEGGKAAPVEREVPPGSRTLSVPFTLPSREGIYFFEVRAPEGITGRSNVLLCERGVPRLHLYFGDIHGHTRLSDGTGTPEDFYRYAREVSGLQIAAVTDHADYGTIPIRGEAWERIERAAAAAYEPGRFVTFLGFEWTNWTYGHRNVYYRDGEGPVFRSIDPESDTPRELWKLLEPYTAMTIAHHVGGGPKNTDWSIPPGPKERLVEISSVHGTSEFYGGEKCIYHPVQGSFVRDALTKGYRLGIIASGDTHDGHPGRRTVGALVTGIFGVYAEALTREAVWAALWRRQAYGTTGPKIILFFRAADAPMGSEVTWPSSRGAVPVALRAVGCAPIAAVEIVRNGKVAFREPGAGYDVRLLVEDPNPGPGVTWYYAKVIQEDGDMAWSSPVWVTRN